MTLDDLLPYVLPHASGCPDIIAKQAIRLAAIELCTKSGIWREYQIPVITVALQTSYAYSLDLNQQVTKLRSLTLDGVDVDLVEPAIGKERDQCGDTGPYAYGGFSGFELHPAQEAGMSIVTYSEVAPSMTATTLPDGLSRYMEGLAQGALSRILTAKDKQYSDPAGAANAQAQWAGVVAGAVSDAMAGFSRATMRTTKVWF